MLDILLMLIYNRIINKEYKMDQELQNLNKAFDQAMEAMAEFNMACIQLKKTINESLEK